MLSEGAGAGGQPEPHAAEADGGARLHHGPSAGLPPDFRQLGGSPVPETTGYSKSFVYLKFSVSGVDGTYSSLPVQFELMQHYRTAVSAGFNQCRFLKEGTFYYDIIIHLYYY